MSAARNDLTKGLWSKPLLLAAALALLSGSASAQMGRGPPRPGDNQSESPVDQQRQKQIDNDYEAATKIVPDQIEGLFSGEATFAASRS